MKFIDYFSNLAMPLMIIIIVLYGVVERKKVFDIFLDGAKDGIKVVFNIFPTLVGLLRVYIIHSTPLFFQFQEIQLIKTAIPYLQLQ